MNIDRFSFIALAFVIASHPCIAFASSPAAKEAASPSGVVEIKDFGFEGPIRGGPWRLLQHAGDRAYRFEHDTEIKTEGKQSFRISRYALQAFAAIEQAFSGLQPGLYRFSADTRATEGSDAGWFLKVIVRNRADGSFDLFSSPGITNQPDWKRASVEFRVKDPTQTIVVGASLRGGGQGWVDNTKLERVAD